MSNFVFDLPEDILVKVLKMNPRPFHEEFKMKWGVEEEEEEEDSDSEVWDRLKMQVPEVSLHRKDIGIRRTMAWINKLTEVVQGPKI